MKYRLASRNAMPPGGWQYIQHPTGWSIPNPTNHSFDAAVRLIRLHREANPQYGLSTIADKVASDLEAFTIARIQNDPRCMKLLIPVDDEAKKKILQPSSVLKENAKRAVARLVHDAKGIATLADWVGDGAAPVSRDLAQLRAETCASCSLNQDTGRRLENIVARAIQDQLGIKRKLMRTIDGEDRLKTCSHCNCYLPLKVWVPLENLDTEGFPSNCWVARESQMPAGRTITVQRKGAIGDVLAATCVADQLHALGYGVRFACVASIRPLLVGHPAIIGFAEPDKDEIDINLDGAYEKHPERKTRSFYDLYLDVAKRSVPSIRKTNYVPRLGLDADELTKAKERMNPHPRPWIVVIPRSNAWPNRTVRQEDWNSFAAKITSGTVFWTGTDPCAAPLVSLTPCDLRQLASAIAHADIVVSVDTGPMHIAAALNRPLVAIEQAFAPELRLSDQTDFSVFSVGLECSPCFDYTCKIPNVNHTRPPCGSVNSKDLSEHVMKRVNRTKVSAIIPVYGENRTRLEKCIAHITDQVGEIVVTMDGNSLTYTSDNVVSVPSKGERRGYGKTCNRGARHSTGEWLLMLNDDCYLNPGAVTEMLKCATDDVAVIGCLLRYPDGTIQHGGTRRGGVGFGHIDVGRREPSIKQPVDMEFVTFAAALVRRTAFYQVRGFDEDFDCYSEDADFCLRVRRAGWRVVYTPHASGVHEESKSSGDQKNTMLRKGNELFKQKWSKHFGL